MQVHVEWSIICQGAVSCMVPVLLFIICSGLWRCISNGLKSDWRYSIALCAENVDSKTKFLTNLLVRTCSLLCTWSCYGHCRQTYREPITLENGEIEAILTLVASLGSRCWHTLSTCTSFNNFPCIAVFMDRNLSVAIKRVQNIESL